MTAVWTEKEPSSGCSRYSRRLVEALIISASFCVATTGVTWAGEKQQSISIVVADFFMLSGSSQFDRLESALPDAVHVALLPYRAIEPVLHSKLWRTLAKKGFPSGVSPDSISPWRIFEQDILKLIQPNYVFWGEFTELDGVIEFSGVLEQFASGELIEVSRVQVDTSRLLSGVGILAHNVVDSLNTLEHLGYGVRRIGVLCFDDYSPAPSPNTEWIARDLVASLPSLLDALPGAKISTLEAGLDDCDNPATVIPIAISAGFDALIGGSYRVDGDELIVSPVVFLTKEWMAIPLPGIVSREGEYLRQKVALAESVRDLFAGILRPTGEWNISEELGRTDVDFKEYIRRGRELLEAGDEQLALVLLDRALAEAGGENAGEAYYLKGRVLLAQQRHREAVASFEAALEMRPDFPDAYVGLGDALLSSGRSGEARDAYERALEHDATAETYKKLGNIHLLEHEFDQAKAAYRHAIAKNPRDPESYYLMGTAHSRERSDRSSERWEIQQPAVEWFKRALEIDASFEPARAHLAEVFRQMGLRALYEEVYEQAFEAFLKETEIAQTPDALFYSAFAETHMLFQQGSADYSHPMETYRKAFRLAKADSAADASFVNAAWGYLNLAELEIVSGDYDAAVVVVSEAGKKFRNADFVKGIGRYLAIVSKILNQEKYEDELRQLENELKAGEASVDGWEFGFLEQSIGTNTSVPAEVKEVFQRVTEKVRKKA
jgi:tetratricopeptide (TPR) repeat protein